MPEPTDTADFFRSRLAEMIDLRHPLAVLASRLPWTQIEAALAPYFARRVRAGRVVEHDDLFGPSLQVAGAGVNCAGRPFTPGRGRGWRRRGRPASPPAPHGQPAVSEARLQAQRRGTGRALGRERAVAVLQRHDLLRATPALR